MSEPKKSPRPKGPRTQNSSGKGGRPSGGPKAERGGKPSGGKRSDRPAAPGKPARKGPAGGRSGAPRKEGDPRYGGGYGKPAREKKSPAKEISRVDDFDMDIDLSDMPPAAFPEPARRGASDCGGAPRETRGGGRKESRGGTPRDARRDDRRDEDRRPPRRDAGDDAPELAEGKSVTAGRNPVRELLESAPKRIDGVFVRKGQRDAKVQEIVALADENRIKVQFVDDVFLRRLFPGTHQGVAAVTAAVEYAELDVLIAAVAAAPLPVLLALDQVQDPGNLGAIARTAWALGAAGILVPRHGGAYIGSGAMRASAGALHHLPVARVTNMSQALDACAEAGLSILCADAEGEDLYKAAIDLPAVLVMGGEEKGVRHGVGKHCQKRLAIPLRRSFDSLNVAQAAAICLARLGQL